MTVLFKIKERKFSAQKYHIGMEVQVEPQK
jgi:hypothetical protein